MLDLKIEKVHFDKTYCLCGCGKTIEQEHWGLKLILNGQIDTFDQCLYLIKKFEEHIKMLQLLTTVCNKCGDCCSFGPEISEPELNYFLNKFPEKAQLYQQIKPALPCPLGGKDKNPCLLNYEARPFQCQILNCQANIIGFEAFYNLLADFLDWSRVKIDNF